MRIVVGEQEAAVSCVGNSVAYTRLSLHGDMSCLNDGDKIGCPRCVERWFAQLCHASQCIIRVSIHNRSELDMSKEVHSTNATSDVEYLEKLYYTCSTNHLTSYIKSLNRFVAFAAPMQHSPPINIQTAIALGPSVP